MAYAVANMVEVLEQDQHHLSLPDCNDQIESFLEKARSWRDILHQHPRFTRKELCIVLVDVAHKAEDVIESHIRNRILLLPLGRSDEVGSELDLTLLVQEFESIMESLDVPEASHSSTKMLARSIFTVLFYVLKFILFAVLVYVLNFPIFAILFYLLSFPIFAISFYVFKILIFTILLYGLSYLIFTRFLYVSEDPDEPWFPVNHLLTSSEVVPWYPKLDPCTRNDVLVFEDDFQTLKARIIEGSSKLQIISIHGIYGMGKRTLARRLYNDPFIATRFRTRAWVSSPTEKDEKGCLLNLMEGLGTLTIDMHQKTVDELKVYLKNTLRDVKYFIVIHDVWDKGNLLTFKRIFRDYRVGTKILFTTVGIDEDIVSTYGECYKMRRLNDSESWLLLRHGVFGQKNCPDELELLGNNIVKMCQGIPLVLSLVAGVLATSGQTPADWELVATTLRKELKGLDIAERQGKLLCLIYFNLPHYLRPCLLYAGVFHEAREIKSSKIIRLWIAEGFVRQSAGECLEDVAETYLKILMDKKRLYLTQEEPNGRVKAFQVHIVLRYTFWMIACLEKLLGSKCLHENVDLDVEKLARRVSAHGLCLPANETDLPSLARSFLSVSGASRRQVSIYLKLKLLRVLEVFQLQLYQFPMEIMQQVLLRYLAFSCHSKLPSSFSILRNLQTLIIRRLPAFRSFSLPSDLWGLTQLRYVKCKENFILCSSLNGEEIVHHTLQTLSNMQLFGVENQFLQLIPNMRNLGIYCTIAMETVFDLARLDKLETLKCSSDWSLASRNFLFFLTLPISLRKLNLSLCRIPSEFMKVVGSLPNLELLKLQKSDFLDADSVQNPPEWVTAEGQFPLLLSLEMLDLNLVHWKANATHFPRLKHLVVRNCYAMVGIPSDIGNIQSLELIQVNETSPSALVSAMQIKKEQEGRGNQGLQILTHRVV